MGNVCGRPSADEPGSVSSQKQAVGTKDVLLLSSAGLAPSTAYAPVDSTRKVPAASSVASQANPVRVSSTEQPAPPDVTAKVEALPRDQVTTTTTTKEPCSGNGVQRHGNGAFAGESLLELAPELYPEHGLPHQIECGPPLPPCNAERLRTVQALNAVTPCLDPALIEAPPDPELNTILKLVASVFQAPACLVALFDDKRIFIRDSEGAFKRGDFPWRWSFCGWTMASANDSIMVIPDATKDARFCQNHAVQNFGVRFYCGSPLIASNGHRLGTLCFADFKPRAFDAASAHILNNLSELVVRHIEKDIALQVRQHSNTALSEAYHNLRRTLDCFEHCVGFVDTHSEGWLLIYTNLSWNKTTGMDRERMQGKRLCDVFTVPGTSSLPSPAHLRHAAACEEFTVTGVRLKLSSCAQHASEGSGMSSSAAGTGSGAVLLSGITTTSKGSPSSSCNSSVLGSGPKTFNLRFRPATKDDLDDGVVPIGIPAHIPRDSPGQLEGSVQQAERFYFVTLEDASKVGSQARSSLSLSSSTLDTPESISGLKMGLLLGKGSYGSVYHATLFGTAVAVKIIERDEPQALDGTPPPVPTEVLVAMEIRHPHIVATLKCATRRLPPRSLYGEFSNTTNTVGNTGSSGASASVGHAVCGNATHASAGTSVECASPFNGDAVVHAGSRAVSPTSAQQSYPAGMGAQGWAIFNMEEVDDGAVAEEDITTSGDVQTLCIGNGQDMASSAEDDGLHSKSIVEADADKRRARRQSTNDSDMDWAGNATSMMDTLDKQQAAGGAAARGPEGRRSLERGPSDRLPQRPSERVSTRASMASAACHEVVPVIPVQTWIVMEFCNKGCLQDAVDRGWLRENLGLGAAPNLRAVLATAHEIASALSFLHSRGIVHGDLSAWNVMLCTSGAGVTDGNRGFIAKVADFGMARYMDVRTKIETQTYGTLTHMPPEALREGIISKGRDVYSFGVLLWQMYTGSRPWAGLSHGQIVYMVAAQHAKLKLSSDCPREYATLVQQCMETNADDRPTMDDIIAQIEEMKDLYCH